MATFTHKIMCAGEGLSVDKSAVSLTRVFIDEAMAGRKRDQNEISVEAIDGPALDRAVAAFPAAYERSSGDVSIIAMDAVAVLACAGYPAAVVASYDLFSEVDALALALGQSPASIRIRLHVALCRASKVVAVGAAASYMVWTYVNREVTTYSFPPIAAYANPARDMTLPILFVIHPSASDTALEYAARMRKLCPLSEQIHVGSATAVVAPTSIALAVHVGRDLNAPAGLRLVDFWASEIPVVQLVNQRSSADAHEAEPRQSPDLVIHNETGLLAANFSELSDHVSTVLKDPIFVLALTRRAKAEAAKHATGWRGMVQQVLS